jgi:CheY-like chemotaxis protein
MLGRWGMKPTAVDSGKRALQAMEIAKSTGHPFPLILLDGQMPEMDGFEATAKIRELEKQTGKHIPIIAMTAHALKGDEARCLEAGMHGYVSKPIRTNELYAALEKVVNKEEESGLVSEEIVPTASAVKQYEQYAERNDT